MDFKTFDGTSLYVNKKILDDQQAVVVMVHGLAEHQGRYDYVANALHENKISTYRFDHRGHGKSQEERGQLDHWDDLANDVNAVLDLATEENPDTPIFLLGHSMGGYAVATFAGKYPDKEIQGIITSGAATFDNAGLFDAIPSDLPKEATIPNELGDGVCSV